MRNRTWSRRVIKEHLENRNLIEEVERNGKSIGTNVTRACEKSSRITGTRTVGTSSWIDTGDYKTTMDLYGHLRENGVLVKLNGSRGVMTKPALTNAIVRSRGAAGEVVSSRRRVGLPGSAPAGKAPGCWM